MKISILIPVYNEAKTLPELLRRVQAAAIPSGCTREIIVVDDGSNDQTARILHGFDGITVIRCDTNRGKGTAIRTGLTKACGDIVLIQDGDLEYDPNDYTALLTPIVEGDSDVVYGSRFLRPTVHGMSRRNRAANRLLTMTANALYNARLSDIATGYKAFITDVFRSLGLQSDRFEFCSEVTAKLLRTGFRIKELPISYTARTIAEGKKIRAKDGLRSLWTLVKLRFMFDYPVLADPCTTLDVETPTQVHNRIA